MSWFIWRIIICLIAASVLVLILTWLKMIEIEKLRPPNPKAGIKKPSRINPARCPTSVSNNSITPITGTRDVMVSAFINDQTHGQVLILSIMKSPNEDPYYCLFCCDSGKLSKSPVESERRVDHFGFPFVTTDAYCEVEPGCNPTHVTISTAENLNKSHQYLPIQVSLEDRRKFDVDFTLCLSCLFGEYNNVLQVVQTIETYKLLGVERVIIYNTSCGSDLEKVLLNYKEEGLLEIIPWPIHHFFVPSEGWNYAESGGEVHYYGQQATISDCVHRNRQRSKYLLLNDADEIIMSYKSLSLKNLIEELQKQNPDAAIFRFWTHVFFTEGKNPSDKFDLPEWKDIPGVNILRYIYRDLLDSTIYNPAKMIINPRKVLQISVHEVLKSSGPSIQVPDDLAIVMHSTKKHPKINEVLKMDKIIWNYTERLIPNVNQELRKSGFLIKTPKH